MSVVTSKGDLMLAGNKNHFKVIMSEHNVTKIWWKIVICIHRLFLFIKHGFENRFNREVDFNKALY